MLYLEHHPLVRLVGSGLGFRDDAVETCALEAAKPIGGGGSVGRCRCQVERWFGAREQRLESSAAFAEWCIAETLVAFAQQIEEDDRRRRFYGQLAHARGSWM